MERNVRIKRINDDIIVGGCGGREEGNGKKKSKRSCSCGFLGKKSIHSNRLS